MNRPAALPSALHPPRRFPYDPESVPGAMAHERIECAICGGTYKDHTRFGECLLLRRRERDTARLVPKDGLS